LKLVLEQLIFRAKLRGGIDGFWEWYLGLFRRRFRGSVVGAVPEPSAILLLASVVATTVLSQKPA
jgi:hypothetical protein